MIPPSPLPPGVRIGHWTDAVGRTGCTVVLPDEAAIGAVDVRGGAPGTRETDVVRLGSLGDQVHAILLTGGSAFGLEAAGGVMRWLDERGIGFAVGPVRVPIVPSAVIFDLLNGDPAARPDAAAGYAACDAASRESAEGLVGAGTGATVAKLRGRELVVPGGLGVAGARAGEAAVCAVMVANAVGGIYDDEAGEWVAPLPADPRGAPPPIGASTTIGVVLTDAALTKAQAYRVAVAAHDGIARAVRPAHTERDGDAMFCLSLRRQPADQVAPERRTGAGEYTSRRHPSVPADVVAIETAAAEVVARAIVRGVRLGNGHGTMGT
ncbi:MAG: P1 family peptidase [Chloroflexota bacterium]|nr:P1 family peptidase [Chloroflexota bacterium]